MTNSANDISLERAKNIATIFSAVAIPIVLTIAGYFIQRELADEGLKKDYVGIASGILKENPATQEPELRTWAIAILEKNSPVPFSSKAREGLLSGMPVILPGPALLAPPKDCRKPSPKRTIYSELEKINREAGQLSQEQLNERLNAFVETVVTQERAALETAANLKCMQRWADIIEQGDIEYRKSIGAPSSKSVHEQLERDRAASAVHAASATSAPANLQRKN